jgi:hypothetical protein
MVAERQRVTIDTLKGKDLRTVHAVEWPGLPDRKVGLLELRCAELLEAYFAAREVFARKGWEAIDAAALSAFEEELHVQYVYRALVDPETQSAAPQFRICKDADQTRARLDPFERDYFAGKLTMLQTETPAGRLLADIVKAKADAEAKLLEGAGE